MTYSIPECNLESLEKKLTRIKNKCSKYGCDFHYKRVGEHFEERSFFEEIGYDSYRETPIYREWKENVKLIDIDVEGTAAVNGWQYAARLEYTENGNLITGVAGLEVPERYYTCKPYCEHCKTNRDRRSSFIVFNTETGEFKQVGKSCLRDFTGGLSAEAAALCESYFKEAEQAQDASHFTGWRRSYYKVDEFMVYLAEVLRLYGYSKRDGYNIGTADRAEELYRAATGMRVFRGEEERVDDAKSKGFDIKNPASVELAATVREWILNNDRNDNYYHNLKVACSMEYCTAGETGLLTSAFPAYDRELEYEAERRTREAKEAEARAKSSWLGKVGDRVKFEIADYYVITTWETQWGTTSVFRFTSTDGREATWKTSNWYTADECIGKTITGTIKELKEFRGVKQTELTRCKIQ